MPDIHALAAPRARAKLEAFTYDPGTLGDEQVEIEVQYEAGKARYRIVLRNDL